MTGAYPVSRYRTALTQPSKHFSFAAAVRKGIGAACGIDQSTDNTSAA